jgi:hypothetical protein
MKYVTKAFVFWALRERALPRDIARYITEVHVPWVPKGMPTISIDPTLGGVAIVSKLYLQYPATTEMSSSRQYVAISLSSNSKIRNCQLVCTWVSLPHTHTTQDIYSHCTWCGRVEDTLDVHFSHVGVPGAVLACPACVSAIALAESK